MFRLFGNRLRSPQQTELLPPEFALLAYASVFSLYMLFGRGGTAESTYKTRPCAMLLLVLSTHLVSDWWAMSVLLVGNIQRDKR